MKDQTQQLEELPGRSGEPKESNAVHQSKILPPGMNPGIWEGKPFACCATVSQRTVRDVSHTLGNRATIYTISLPSRNEPQHKNFESNTQRIFDGSLSDVFKGDSMQAIQFRNALQRKARERAQRIREARLVSSRAW
jgi:hypothetical protein